MSDTPIQDNIEANGGKYVGDEVMRFHKRVIPLLADELRLICRVVYNTPEGQRYQDFQLSAHDGETTLFDLWLDLQDDIGSWLKKVKR